MKRKGLIIIAVVLLALGAGSCVQPMGSQIDIPKGLSDKNANPDLILEGSGTTESSTFVSAEDHFFFLPPLAPKPAYEGTFAADVDPVVRVSIVNEEELEPLVEFTGSGKGSEQVRQDFSEDLGDFYIVNLHLKNFDIPLYSRLLIEVYIDELKLGSIEAVTIPNGSEKISVENGFPLVMNRTVPIKFRIEEEFFEQIKQ